MTLREQIADAEKRIAQIRDAIAQRVLELPDNPRIQRLSGNAFVMSSRDLGDNWSVEHHDFKRQYEFIAAEMQRKELPSVLPFLQLIIEKGSCYDSAKNRHTFHQDVRKYLAEIVGSPDLTPLT